MGSAAQHQPGRMTVDEYLVFELTADVKHEYRDGVIVDMAGTTYEHSVITLNASVQLHQRLQGKACRALDSNMRVRITRKSKYYYPDASVVCGEPDFDPGPKGTSRRTITNPRVIVEVLSDSTEAFDRGGKFTDYREIPSLREYVLIAQHAPQVEVYLRQDDGTWRFQPSAGLAAVARLDSLGIDLPLAEVYAGVTFEAAAPAADPDADA
jgi:Uma2 family endonuclease